MKWAETLFQHLKISCVWVWECGISKTLVLVSSSSAQAADSAITANSSGSTAPHWRWSQSPSLFKLEFGLGFPDFDINTVIWWIHIFWEGFPEGKVCRHADKHSNSVLFVSFTVLMSKLRNPILPRCLNWSLVANFVFDKRYQSSDVGCCCCGWGERITKTVIPCTIHWIMGAQCTVYWDLRSPAVIN